MIRTAREHLDQAGEGYLQHLRFAALVGAMLIAAGLACLIHAILPSLCRRSGSSIVAMIGDLMRDRGQLKATADAASGTLTLVGLLALSAVPVTLILAKIPYLFGVPLALLVAALPLTYLLSNPDLDPV